MKKKITLIMMVMKSKLFITVLFLIMGSKINAQDSLNVYIEKNQEYRTGVDLVFENNSIDTIFLFTKFHNFSLGGEIPHYSGICIEYFSNNESFTFNWGETPPLMFIFSDGKTLIYPKSKIKLFFDVGNYFQFPEKAKEKYDISFFMNYLFTKYNSSEMPISIHYFRTNRVTIIKPMNE